MAGPFYNNIKGTTSGTPGTAAFTPNASAPGARAWSTVPAGWIGLVRYEEGSADEESYSYWDGTTLSRGANQVVGSSTGSILNLSSAATAELVADGSEIAPHPVVPWSFWAPHISSGSMVGTTTGPGLTITGTGVAATWATTNALTEQSRIQITSATTANAQAGASIAIVCAVVNTSAGRGGFEFATRFGASQLPTGNRVFIGMTSATFVANTGEPSAFTANYATFAKDSTDTNIQLLTNSNASGGTKVDTGIPLVANGWYESSIWCDPGSNTVRALLIRLDTGAIFYATTSTDAPVNGALLFPQSLMGLSATTGTAVIMHQGGLSVRAGAG